MHARCSRILFCAAFSRNSIAAGVCAEKFPVLNFRAGSGRFAFPREFAVRIARAHACRGVWGGGGAYEPA